VPIDADGPAAEGERVEAAQSSSNRVAFPPDQAVRARFAERDAGLAAILGSSEIERISSAYHREDERAEAAQGQFLAAARQLNIAALATATISALILALGIAASHFGRDLTVLFALLGIAGLAVGGYAAARLHELKVGDLAGDWMRSRARAEQLRNAFFEQLAARAASGSRDTQLAAFDLVNEYLLEDQLAYFAWRGKQHEQATSKWLRYGAFATGIASIGTAAGGLGGVSGQLLVVAVAALGTIGAAVAAFAAAQETIGQERERAQRFRNNVDALELLARRVDEVREAIAAGAPDALVTFTAAINQQLSLELGRFLEGGDSIRSSIDALGRQIEDARQRRSDGAA